MLHKWNMYDIIIFSNNININIIIIIIINFITALPYTDCWFDYHYCYYFSNGLNSLIKF